MNFEKYKHIQNKIFDRESIKKRLAFWKFKSQKIVFSNGCFDILHKGHVEYLAKAAEFGDVLIIGLNSDSSVKRLKGANRPVQDENTRALILAALQFVDAVILFDSDTPKDLIEFINPDVLVKGKDYAINQIVGADFVLNNGGKVETIELVEGQSTTNVIEKIKTF